MGVGDEVPAAIDAARREGRDACRRDDLAWGDLSRFPTIVTGVRAYERRADLRANNSRLLDYVRNGGTLIVQYNKFEFNEAQYGPYRGEGHLRSRHRRERAGQDPRSGRSGVDHAQQDHGRGVAGMGPGARAVLPRRARLAAIAISSSSRIRSRTMPARSAARSSLPITARAAGSTSASGCGASCRPVSTARINCWPI